MGDRGLHMEPETRLCVQNWYLFALSHLSYLVWLSLGILPYTCFGRPHAQFRFRTPCLLL